MVPLGIVAGNTQSRYSYCQSYSNILYIYINICPKFQLASRFHFEILRTVFHPLPKQSAI